MNILVISTIDRKGGAAQISWELRKRLKADGHRVNTFVRYKYSDESDVFVIPRKRFQDWLVKIFANDLTFANTGYIFNTKEYKEADIIHCHNLHSNFFNLRDIARMSRDKKVVWTLHDIWAITGYANDSATRSNPNKKRFMLYLWDNTNRLLRCKKEIYSRAKLNIVTVSEWLKYEVQNSILSGQNIIRIYNGIDTNIFIPKDKLTIRKELALPLEKKIIAFVLKGTVDSNIIVDSYKDRDDIFFMAIGNTTIKTPNKNFISLGYIENKEILSKYISSIDVFLYPTHGDTFGLIVAEAMSCGIPVVTYDIDALPEIVDHRINGYIAEYRDIDDLKKGIEYIVNLGAYYSDFHIKARNKILERFTINKMYAEYLKLYESLIDTK